MKLTRKILIEKIRMFYELPKTFKEVCDIADMSPKDFEYDYLEKDEIAYKKLKLIVRILNENWVPNWEDENESKFYPYFKMSSSFGFLATAYVNWNTNSDAGSRLCFKTEKLAEYAGRMFEDIYRDFLT